MTRREALGLLIAAALTALGRGLRGLLLTGPDGAWRDPLWLDDLIPREPEPEPEPEPPRPPFRINAVGADTLVHLPGVGPVLAGRIVAEREAGGPFADAADLRRVKGIGPRLSARLDTLLIFGAPEDTSGSRRAPGGR